MTPNPPPPSAKRLRLGLVIAATGLSLLIGAGVVAFILSLDSLLRERIVAEARRLGIELEPGKVDVWFGTATIHDARFRLVGVRGVQATARTIDVALSGLTPLRVVADGVQIDATGSASDLIVDVGEWAKNYPQALAAPGSARNIGVTLRAATAREPWLVLRDGQLSEAPGGATFSAGGAKLAGVEVGAVGASWTANAAAVSLSLGSSGADAPLRVDVAHAEKPPRATIVLRPIELSDLSGPLGVKLPVENVKVSGTAEMAFVETLETGPVHGKLAAILDGYVPPHPVELDGFIFGNRTTLSSTFAIAADRATVALTDTRVKAGAFGLEGGGKVIHVEDHATVEMDLSGSLPCTAVADSAAKARLGSVLGKMLGETAKQILDGSVAVRVRVEADTRRLEEAKVERQIGIGCGLKPLGLRDLAKLGLSTFEDLVREMPSVRLEGGEVKFELPPAPSNLPPLPSTVPPFPSALPGVPKTLPFPFDFKLGKPADPSKAPPSKAPPPKN